VNPIGRSCAPPERRPGADRVDQFGDGFIVSADRAFELGQLRGEVLMVDSICRIETNVRTTSRLTSIARSEFSTLPSISVPCSVKPEAEPARTSAGQGDHNA